MTHNFKNLCKKVPGKKVSGKKPGIKTLEKSPNFLKSLEKMSLEIKFWIPGTFFPKIVWGLPIKSQEIRSQEKKKINPRKRKTCAFSLVRGLFSEDFFV